jgi:hypothetical protein
MIFRSLLLGRTCRCTRCQKEHIQEYVQIKKCEVVRELIKLSFSYILLIFINYYKHSKINPFRVNLQMSRMSEYKHDRQRKNKNSVFSTKLSKIKIIKKTIFYLSKICFFAVHNSALLGIHCRCPECQKKETNRQVAENMKKNEKSINVIIFKYIIILIFLIFYLSVIYLLLFVILAF